MKKLSYLIVIVLISSLVLAGCSLLSNISQVPVTEQKYNENNPNPYVFGSGDLVAGQNIKVGTVNVWNDVHNLYVKYELNDGWCMTESHLAVATSLAGIPQTKNGNPIPGKFEYGDNYDQCASEDTFTISLASLGGGGTQLYIAAHASLLNLDNIIGYVPGTEDPIYQEETAWGYGSPFEGKNWATYFNYTVQLPQDGMVLWLDANAITGFSDGDKITQWDDLSGEDNHATQTTEDNKPTYKTNILNNLPVVRFNGSTTRLKTGNIATIRTVFVVFQTITHKNYNRVFDWRVTNGYSVFGRATGVYEGRYNSNTSQIIFGTLTIGQPYIIVCIHDGTTLAGWLDGVSIGSKAATTKDDAGAFVIADRGAYDGTQVLNGDIAEILVYNRALSDSEREFVETYLKAKYYNI